MKSPVELIRDKKGVYGVGISEDVEIVNGLMERHYLLLRSDRLPDDALAHDGDGAVLQCITSGRHQGMFARTLEERLRKVIHRDLLNSAGLASPSTIGRFGGIQYTSKETARRARDRQIFHSFRLRSLSIVNKLMGHALEVAAVPEALKQARRFAFRDRQRIYQAGAKFQRRLQLIDTFPALALAIFCPPYDEVPDNIGAQVDLQMRSEEGSRLVERGVPLKQIADFMDIPMALQKVKPGAAHLALPTLANCGWDARLVDAQMPSSLPQMKLWLRSVRSASELGPEFVQWVAKHGLAIGPGRLADISDWVRACYRESVPSHLRWALHGSRLDLNTSLGDELVTRSFNPDMSPTTVVQLSHEWHEAVASILDGPAFDFPEPWSGAERIGKYEIVPITKCADLYREGHAMHHCVGTLGGHVRSGDSYYYSVRKRGKRVATALLCGPRDRVSLGALKGPCNSDVPKDIERTVRGWVGIHFPRAEFASDLDSDITLEDKIPF